MTRISRRHLEELDTQLTDRDKNILRTLQTNRYLTTGQIKRLYFADHASALAALRATNRGLSKLQDFGLIGVLRQRRIGGYQAGSGSYIWLLKEAGAKLLHLQDKDEAPRNRSFEPSPTFLNHTLAVAETYVQIMEICRKHQMEAAKIELEPTCWRSYKGEDGNTAVLKPDLYAATVNGEFEDNWFMEMDLASESLSVVLEKCQRYARYYKSAIEQKKLGVFPLVVWIVPSETRQKSLQQSIANSRELQPKNIFLVITPDQFETLLSQGAEALSQKKGDA